MSAKRAAARSAADPVIPPARVSEPANLNDRAYDLLKRDIIWCELSPGDEVSEAQLAARYDLGKAPIRAALARLRQEGLVDVRARKGYLITPMTIRDVREIFGLRLLIEPEIARMAAGHVDAETLKKLDAAVQAGYTPGDRASEAAFLAANKDFHLAVAQAAGNWRVVRVLERTLDECNRVLHMGLALADFSGKFQHEHQELIQALLKGDADKAAKLTYDAVSDGRDIVIEGLLSSPGLSVSRPGR